jgi:hypothetical protein
MPDTHFENLDAGRITAASAYLPLLRANRFDTFEGVMGYRGGDLMRSVPGRFTVRVELRNPAGGSQVAFLKRYETAHLTPRKRCLRWLHWPGSDDEAWHEWRAIQVLRAAGFRTAEPMAVGQWRRGGLVTRSFLLTAEIRGGVAAHDYTRARGAFARRRLAHALADLTRRLHGAGFVHKDYYLSHIFVVPAGEEDAAGPIVEPPPLYLIDLQRLTRPRGCRTRWRVKDLAALAYSAQLAGATSSDLLRFYRAYRGPGRPGSRDHAFARRVLARVAALHRRGPKYDVIWDQPGVHPPNV